NAMTPTIRFFSLFSSTWRNAGDVARICWIEWIIAVSTRRPGLSSGCSLFGGSVGQVVFNRRRLICRETLVSREQFRGSDCWALTFLEQLTRIQLATATLPTAFEKTV
ncbi:MAG TPA: hypothetical protein VFQ43_05440, partial [Nitrososphaera sp.]|nr:hypothetical protein [Nitrososphaera sp.]